MALNANISMCLAELSEVALHLTLASLGNVLLNSSNASSSPPGHWMCLSHFNSLRTHCLLDLHGNRKSLLQVPLQIPVYPLQWTLECRFCKNELELCSVEHIPTSKNGWLCKKPSVFERQNMFNWTEFQLILTKRTL